MNKIQKEECKLKRKVNWQEGMGFVLMLAICLILPGLVEALV